MRRLGMIGACLAAVLAFAGLVASSAFAEGPEWGHCLHTVPSTGKEQKKGNYTEANCQTVAEKEKKGHKEPDHKGGYEWYGGTAPICMKQTEGKYKWGEKECKTEKFKENKKTKVKEYKGKYALSSEVGKGPKFEGHGGKGVLSAEYRGCEENNGAETFFATEPGACENIENNPRCKANPECARGKGYHEDIILGGPIEVECTSESNSGEAVGTDGVANIAVVFKGCVGLEVPCTSPHAAPGEIRIDALKGELGYINKSAHEVGVLLEPASGERFAKFECEGVELEVEVGKGDAAEGTAYEAGPPYSTPGSPSGGDGIISKITPIDQMTSKFTQVYETNNKDENLPTSFELGKRKDLESLIYSTTNAEFASKFSRAGETITNENTPEGEVEIKA